MRKKGGFYYALVEDQDGIQHRVHKDCVDDAVGFGIKKVILETTEIKDNQIVEEIPLA